MSRDLLLPLAAAAFLIAIVLNAQTAPPALSLRGVSALNADEAWASGTQGTYLHTHDGGRTMTRHSVPGAGDLDFRDIEVIDRSTIYLMAAGPGEKSRIYKTTDGGNRWSLQFINHDPHGFLDCMAFWDQHHGIVVGDPVGGKFMVLTTDDGGQHWNQPSSIGMPPAVDGEGAFAASGTCIAVEGKKDAWFVTGGTVARVFHSKDRGTTWTVATTPLLHGKPPQGGFAIAFRDAHHGLIVGGDYQDVHAQGANIAYSEDGGARWSAIPNSPSTSVYLSAIRYLPDGRAVATGPAGTVLISSDHHLVAKEGVIGNTCSVVPGLAKGHGNDRESGYSVFIAGPGDIFKSVRIAAQ